jgi:hypothetical protein
LEVKSHYTDGCWKSPLKIEELGIRINIVETSLPFLAVLGDFV